MDPEAPGPEIIDDEPCPRCGYNLRGLREGGRCPECGGEIALSFDGPNPDESLRAVADATRKPFEAVSFVVRALAFVALRASRAGRHDWHFTAEEFRWGLRDFALEEFGDPDAARTQLAVWGLNEGRDFAAVIFALAEQGLPGVPAGLQREHFHSLFTLQTLFERPD